MSQENVESARRAVEIYNTHDVAALQGITTNDVEFRTFLEGRAEAEPLRGHEGVEEWQRSESEAWESLKVEPSEFRDLGENRVLVVGELRGRGRASGLELNAPAASVLEMRESKVCAFHAYTSRAEALEAAGLEE
jgi:ketosteroid isomerase-like protein